MAHHQESQGNTCEADGCADAFAAVTVITVVVAAVVYWLAGMA